VIDEGIAPGERVITSGQYKVQPGTLVGTSVADAAAKVGQE
jgi:multidrug efflux system membrane fusion protein